MNKTFKVVAVALLAGGPALALAQSPKASFADTFSQMQALSSNSSQWQPAQPTITRQAIASRDPLSFRDYQALASNSSRWQAARGSIGVDEGPRFAKTHPQGIPFADYQAIASNSDAFQTTKTAGLSSVATNDDGNLSAGNGSTLRDRLARVFPWGPGAPAVGN